MEAKSTVFEKIFLDNFKCVAYGTAGINFEIISIIAKCIDFFCGRLSFFID
jgi:hypothetical protein